MVAARRQDPVSTSITIAELVRFCGIRRQTLRGWTSSSYLKGAKFHYKGRFEWRIQIQDAIDFFRDRGCPCEGLERHAQRIGVLPLAAPALLLCSPQVDLAGPFSAAGWVTTIVGTPVHAGIALAQRHWLATVVDGAFGYQSIMDLLSCSGGAGVLVLLQQEDDCAEADEWKRRGFNVVYKRPVDLGAVAMDVKGLVCSAGRA